MKKANIDITKVVTHAGTHHADDVAATELVAALYPNAKVERTYTPAQEDFEDPCVLVHDIGRRFEPKLHNYDHHHNAKLPAASSLVAAYLYMGKQDLLAGVENLLEYISRVDVGEVVETTKTPLTVVGAIRATNNNGGGGFEGARRIFKGFLELSFDGKETHEAFFMCADEAQNFLSRQGKYGAADAIRTAMRSIEVAQLRAAQLLAEAKKMPGVILHNETELIYDWQTYAEQNNAKFLVYPSLRGGWQVQSRDSAKFPILTHPSQTFLHNSRFTAAYATQDEALAHALALAKIYEHEQ